MDHKFVSKNWGYEIWIENNADYCCKHLHVVPNMQCSVHYHKNKTETFYIIEGELLLFYLDRYVNIHYESAEGVMTWDKYKKSIVLCKGESFTIPPRTLHTFTSNLSYPCDFIEASTEHKDEDSYRIRLSGAFNER